MSFVGFAALDAAFAFPVLVVDSSDLPTNSSATPSYRVRGAAGVFATGNLSFMETASITGASSATPISITSAAHGLTTGQLVTIASVGGNTAANGTWTITRTGADTFTLDTSTWSSGAYTSGGTWKTTGHYLFSVTPTTGAGYAAENWYDVFVQTTVSGSTKVFGPFRFGVTG